VYSGGNQREMEIDVLNVSFDLNKITPVEIEECLEDPYALRVLPDVDFGLKTTRYYLIGKTLRGRAVFLSFTTNGKVARIIFAREASDVEQNYYERQLAEF